MCRSFAATGWGLGTCGGIDLDQDAHFLIYINAAGRPRRYFDGGGRHMNTTLDTSGWRAAAAAAVFAAAITTGTAAERPSPNTGTTATEHNKEVALRWSQELWGLGHLAVADEIIAPDYVRHDPGDPFPAHGPEDVKRIVTMLRTMLPDLRIEVEAVVAEGDFVVSRYTATATDTVGYMGMPPTGKPIRTSAMQMFRFSNGQIVESWAVRDDLGTLRQLGIAPLPGNLQKR
jgi:predicted SnoaL-like aldol condensation-catalyzing enzyme